MKGLIQYCTLLIILMISAASAADLSDNELWQALQSPDHFALMRHARAPGFGDPAGFNIKDCATQRNLGDEGKQQASRMGAALAANGIRSALIYSSQWCRCQDTGKGLGAGAVKAESLLDPMPKDRPGQEKQSKELLSWIQQLSLREPTLIITHQINITRLVESFASPGQMLVVERQTDGSLKMLGILTIN
jgi:phosphohistidine phosphatase SixA